MTTPQHQWLQQLVGTWTYEVEAATTPDKPDEKLAATETVRSLGGLWTVAEGTGEMPDGSGPFTTIMTLGFDPRKGRFTGTFIASMMTYLWIYDGELDADQRVLTLHAEGPAMSGEDKLYKYRDVVTIVTPDHRTLTSHFQTEDGEWQQFMTAHYRRVK